TFLFARKRSLVMSLLLSGAFVVLARALLSTGSRGALVSLLLALTTLFVVALRSVIAGNRKVLSRCIAALLMIAMGAMFAAEALRRSENAVAFERYQFEQWKKGSGRFDTWRGALNVAKDHYFVGVGIGQYRTQHIEAMKQLEKLYTPSVVSGGLGAHSEYLSIL